MKAKYTVGEIVFFKRYDGSVWSAAIVEVEFQFGQWVYWINGYTGWVKEENVKRTAVEFSRYYTLNKHSDPTGN